MAENNSIGEIYFGVNADTDKLLASVSTVKTETTRMANSFLELDKVIGKTNTRAINLAEKFGGASAAAKALESQITRLGGTVTQSGIVLDNNGVKNIKLTNTLKMLRDANNEVVVETKKSIATLSDLASTITNAESKAASLAGKYNGAEAAIEQFQQQVVQLGGSVNSLGQVIDSNGVKNTKLTSVMQSLRAATGDVEQENIQTTTSFQQLTSVIAGTESGSSKLAAQFGGAGAAAAQLENEIRRLGGQVQANGNVVDQFGVRNAKLTATLAALRGATFQTTNSFRMMRGGMQQIGYQVQDVAVQLQMGANPLMVLGQQGSQVASLFGKHGALFGALLAVSAAIGTALIPSLFDSKDAIDEVTKAAEEMGKAIDIEDGVGKFTKELERISKVSREAAKSMLAAEMVKANTTIAKSVDAVGTEFEKVATDIDSASRTYDQYKTLVEAGITMPEFSPNMSEEDLGITKVFDNMQAILGSLNKEFGLTTEQSEGLLQAFLEVRNSGTPESIMALESALIKLNNETKFGSEELTTFIDTLWSTFDATKQAAQTIGIADSALIDLDGTLAAHSQTVRDAQKGYNDLIKNLEEEAATAGMSARQLHLYQVEQLLIKANHEEMIPLFKRLVNARHDDIDAAKAATDADKARNQEIKNGTKSLNDQIMAMAIKAETLGMDARELAKHTAMQIINTKSLDVNKDSVMQAIDSYYDLIEAKEDEIDADKKATQERKRAEKSFDDLRQSIENELEVVGQGGGDHELFIRKIQLMGKAADQSQEDIDKLIAKANELNEIELGDKKKEAIEDLQQELRLMEMRNNLTSAEYQTQLALMSLKDQGIDLTPDEESEIAIMIQEMEQLRFMAELTGQSLETAFQDIGVSAIDSLSSGIANAIKEGDSLSDTLSNIARTIASEVLGSVIRYYVGKAAAAVMADKVETGSAIASKATQTAASVTAAGTITAAMAPAAAATAAATGGVSAKMGLAALAIAIPAMMALMMRGGGGSGGSTATASASGAFPATAMGGGRLYGGRTEAGKLHPILEDGKPEMLTMGNRNYLMTPSSGMVTSNKDMMGGGANVTLNINNYAGVPVTTNTRTEGSGTSKQEIIDVVVGDMRNYGQIHQAMTDTTTATGRVR